MTPAPSPVRLASPVAAAKAVDVDTLYGLDDARPRALDPATLLGVA